MDRLTSARRIKAAMTSEVEMMAPAGAGQGTSRIEPAVLEARESEHADSPAPSIGRLPIPAHVAIIMDGNGRWAASRGLPRVEGHRDRKSVV